MRIRSPRLFLATNNGKTQYAMRDIRSYGKSDDDSDAETLHFDIRERNFAQVLTRSRSGLMAIPFVTISARHAALVY